MNEQHSNSYTDIIIRLCNATKLLLSSQYPVQADYDSCFIFLFFFQPKTKLSSTKYSMADSYCKLPTNFIDF